MTISSSPQPRARPKDATSTLDLRRLLGDIYLQGLGNPDGANGKWSLRPAELVLVWLALRERASAEELSVMTLLACETTIHPDGKTHYGYRVAISHRGKLFGQHGVSSRQRFEASLVRHLMYETDASDDVRHFVQWADEARTVKLCESGFVWSGLEKVVGSCVERELALARADRLSRACAFEVAVAGRRIRL